MSQEFESDEDDVEYQDSEEPESIDDGGEEFQEIGHEQEDSEEPSQKQARDKHDFRDKLAQAQRERYQALRDIESLRQQNELLRKSVEVASSHAVQQYDENLNRRLENAKLAKVKAMEEGDVHAQVEADTELSLVSSELYNSNLRKAEHNIQANQQQYQQQYESQYSAPPVDNSFYEAEWERQNPWCNPESNQYDGELTQAVASWCSEFNSNLQRGGRQDLISSPDYFQAVNQYVNSLRQPRGQSNNKRELNMRQSRAPISPVRNGYSQNSGRQQSRLTKEEKEYADAWGIDDKLFLQAVVNDQNHPKRYKGRS